MGVTVLIAILAAGCLWGAVRAWTRQDWPVGVRLLASLGFLALVALLFPAPLRVPIGARIPQDQGPELRRLVDQVAAAVGTRAPDAIVIDMSLNAGVARFG